MTVGGLTEYEHVGSLGRGQSGEGMELGCSCHGHRGRMGGKRSLGKLWGGEGSVIPGGSEQGASPSCSGPGPGVIARLVDICTCWGLRVLHPQAPETCFCSSLVGDLGWRSWPALVVEDLGSGFKCGLGCRPVVGPQGVY